MAQRNYNKKSGKFPPKKKVEIDVDRDDINKADLIKSSNNGKKTRYRSEKNDVTWYVKNPELLNAAAQFPFGYPLGVDLPKSNTSSKSIIQYDQTVPGIFVLPYVPTIGRSNDGASPVNLAAKIQYSNVRYANSGTTYGDPSDLMMYFLAIDSAYMFHQWMIRAYGVLRTYNYMNRYYPQAVIEAMGLDFDNLNANITQLWGYINTYGVKLQSFALPGDLSYVIRHSWLASGLYLDANSSKAQTYLFNPIMYYQWTEVTEGPNYLKAITMFTSSGDDVFPNVKTGQRKLTNIGKKTLNDLREFGDSLLKPILQSESFGLTTGALLKAYGMENLMKIAQIPEDYQVIPAYNAEVLSQIENATLFTDVNFSSSYSSFNITQSTAVDDMFITANPKLTSMLYSWASGAAAIHAFSFHASTSLVNPTLLNMHVEKPMPADVMVATRLTALTGNPYVNPVGSGTNYTMQADLQEFGSEIILNPYIITYQRFPGTTEPLTAQMVAYPLGSSVIMVDALPDPVLQVLQESIAMAQQFDWHPSLCLGRASSTGSDVSSRGQEAILNYTFLYDTRDLDVFAIINADNLRLLNEVAMLSLFDSPRVAKLVSKPYRS